MIFVMKASGKIFTEGKAQVFLKTVEKFSCHANIQKQRFPRILITEVNHANIQKQYFSRILNTEVCVVHNFCHEGQR